MPVLAAAVTGGCAAYVARQQHSAPGARAYTLVLLSQTIWSLGYVAELLSADVGSKVFWDDLQLPPPYLMALGMLLFAFEYSGRADGGAQTVVLDAIGAARPRVPLGVFRSAPWACPRIGTHRTRSAVRRTALRLQSSGAALVLGGVPGQRLCDLLLAEECGQAGPGAPPPCAAHRRRDGLESIREPAWALRLSLVRTARFGAILVCHQRSVRVLGVDALPTLRSDAHRAPRGDRTFARPGLGDRLQKSPARRQSCRS